METQVYNCAALTNFERFEFAVNGGFVSKAPLERRVAEIAKTESADSFRYPDVQNTLPYRGFFVRAVLHTKASAQVGGVEQTDERTLIDAGRARCVIPQDAQKVGIKGVKSRATGFSIGAVADTGYLTQHRTNKDGTANRTGGGMEFTPTPALALLSLE